MRLPQPRGPLSSALFPVLSGPPGELPPVLDDLAGTARTAPLTDDDLQITLWACYELHYRGFDEVDEDWEWAPSLLRLRGTMEAQFERALRRLTGKVPAVTPDRVTRALAELVDSDDGPELARYMQHHATLEQYREFVRARSIYHLKEADPHSWGIPRLAGRAKAALVEIQAYEYGGGRSGRMHSELFRRMMRALDLDDSYGAYIDEAPAIVLAGNNAMSLFGLHRRLRGALAGHLAAFEMTSSVPNRRYGNGLRRLGFDRDATWFHDEHVEADAVHEQVAAHDLCGGFATAEPERASDVLFGAACCLVLDNLAAGYLLGRWEVGAPAPVDRPGVAAPA
jgi:hypothetical protein